MGAHDEYEQARRISVMNTRVSGLVFPLALVMVAGSALVGSGHTSTAHAATCTAVPGHAGFTAVLSNPSSTVSGTIDATGCDYGVYVGPGHTATVSHATIFGAKAANVAADGTVTVSASHLYASPDGIDFGEFMAGAGGEADGNSIEYTGDGCGMMLWGGKESLTGNRITGPGRTPQPFGIDAFSDAVVIATQNTVSNNDIGMVLTPIGAGSRITGNVLQNNTTGIETRGTDTLIAANTVRVSTTGIDPDGNRERVMANTVCASTNATPIATADAVSPPTVLGNRTTC
jgi:nitrous oxidase accessory protein NosD